MKPRRKGVAFQIRVSEENAAVLRAMAAREGRSPSNYLAKLLSEDIRGGTVDLSDAATLADTPINAAVLRSTRADA